jgi:uncharacterized protein YidB (DUF937 family)
MFDALVTELSERYGLGDRGRDLFGLLMAYIHNDRRGGFPGFIEGFREQGHGALVASWLGDPGGGQPLNASDVGMVFGQGLLSDWGGRLGVSRATVAAAIAGVLPRLVAALTPDGRVPDGPSMASPRTSTGAAPVRAADAGIERAAHEPASGTLDLGNVVPGEEHRPVSETHGATPPVPDLATADATGHDFTARDVALRAPVAARQARDARAATLDPTEQRIADMAAAFGSGRDAPHADPKSKPDYWRPAVHPPRRGRRSLRWLWWLIVLAALAGTGYAWSLGLLDPYIRQVNPQLRQFDLMIPTRLPSG